MTTLDAMLTEPADGPSRVDRISARAAAVDWRKVLLTVLMVLPFAVFYAARLVVRAVGWTLAWLWAAGMEGWTAAGPSEVRRAE